MNTWTITRRILLQFKRDKRSIALMIAAPIFVLTLMWLVLESGEDELKIAAIDVPEAFEEQLAEKEEVNLIPMEESKAKSEMADAGLDAFVLWENGEPSVTIEGSDPNTTSDVRDLLQKALGSESRAMEIEFLHGSEDLGLFDYIGPVLIGFFVFFFVFIVGGVSLLRERTQGTLERILSTPLKRSELVFGYLLGFGLFTIVQSFLIAAYSIYVLDMFMEGRFFYVLLVTFLLAMTALSLGTLLSAFAKNEFQMIQFIPVVIVPQVFFSGLFPLEGMADWLQAIGRVMPLTYGAEALRGIMIRNESFSDFQLELYVLTSFIALFTLLNISALKRHRRI
ncbi:ABC transporter permease [Halobacillus sp. A5]|uniref:ABC transporter permease n=1 Tax=Halobacillus sp. A5 TaxID=2880263 RepID=UPI0020A64140|nr:ABC transporter permease [Halobacillus sp. A5]MCP3027336.1 ABC transporter permease [Halobacillus sp. A5]